MQIPMKSRSGVSNAERPLLERKYLFLYFLLRIRKTQIWRKHLWIRREMPRSLRAVMKKAIDNNAAWAHMYWKPAPLKHLWGESSSSYPYAFGECMHWEERLLTRDYRDLLKRHATLHTSTEQSGKKRKIRASQACMSAHHSPSSPATNAVQVLNALRSKSSATKRSLVNGAKPRALTAV